MLRPGGEDLDELSQERKLKWNKLRKQLANSGQTTVGGDSPKRSTSSDPGSEGKGQDSQGLDEDGGTGQLLS